MSEVYSGLIRKYFNLQANRHFQYAVCKGVFKSTKFGHIGFILARLTSWKHTAIEESKQGPWNLPWKQSKIPQYLNPLLHPCQAPPHPFTHKQKHFASERIVILCSRTKVTLKDMS